MQFIIIWLPFKLIDLFIDCFIDFVIEYFIDDYGAVKQAVYVSWNN